MNQPILEIPFVDHYGQPVPDLPDIENLVTMMAQEIAIPTVLIEGLLHTGGKMVIGGSSKTFKTWLLTHLAVNVAMGMEWLGLTTHPGPVLFINLEIQRPFMRQRFEKVLTAQGQELGASNLDVWNLRGHAADLTLLRPRMLARLKERHYSLIIVDPIYKCLGDRDENKAGDIASLMNEVERLAQGTGAAVVFGAHFSKGNQAGKDSIDRIGGSGVFARDPDTILIMTQHKESDAFVVETTLRNFPPMKPFCVRWGHPLMKRADDLCSQDLKPRFRRSAIEATDEEFLSLFPETWPDGKPREALRSHSELERACKLNRFSKNIVVGCRNRLQERGSIAVVRAHNQVLAGRPGAVEEFRETQKQAEEGHDKGKSKAVICPQFSGRPDGSKQPKPIAPLGSARTQSKPI